MNMSITSITESNAQLAPVKWLKHMVLVEWKLREEENLLESIHRYRIEDYQSCFDDIKQQITQCQIENVYIIKLVPLRDFYKLPNLLIDKETDIEEVCKKVKNKQLERYAEIWYCCNKIQNQSTVFGRMLFGKGELYPSRCSMRIELVWGGSARNIERYPYIDCPYVAVEKENWNAIPMIKEMIPKDMKKEKIISTSIEITRKIAFFYTKIKDFGTYVFSKGCNRLSLEFSYCDGKFSFIDWDSDADEKVLL